MWQVFLFFKILTNFVWSILIKRALLMQKNLLYIPIFILLNWLSLGNGVDVYSSFNQYSESVISIPTDEEHSPIEAPAEKEEKEEDRTEEDSEREKDDSNNDHFEKIDFSTLPSYFEFNSIINNSYVVASRNPKNGARWIKCTRYICCNQLKIVC